MTLIGLALLTCVLACHGEDPIRRELLRRGQVWESTDIAAQDLLAGPVDGLPLALDQTVRCRYAGGRVHHKMGGANRKFLCALPGNPTPVLIRYGHDNAEIYGGVLASRLLWALGFGADGYYPVRVECLGCPPNPWESQAALPAADATDLPVRDIYPATLVMRMPGADLPGAGPGWTLDELAVAPAPGGAPSAQRDALRLLAAFMQHLDNKASNQAIAHRGGAPILYLRDVGVAFGAPSLLDRDEDHAVNLPRWRDVPVFLDEAQGIASLGVVPPQPGYTRHPRISAEGRRFLACLLNQLREEQIRDLFRAGRVTLRDPHSTVADWAQAFLDKRRSLDPGVRGEECRGLLADARRGS